MKLSIELLAQLEDVRLNSLNFVDFLEKAFGLLNQQNITHAQLDEQMSLASEFYINQTVKNASGYVSWLQSDYMNVPGLINSSYRDCNAAHFCATHSFEKLLAFLVSKNLILNSNLDVHPFETAFELGNYKIANTILKNSNNFLRNIERIQPLLAKLSEFYMVSILEKNHAASTNFLSMLKQIIGDYQKNRRKIDNATVMEIKPFIKKALKHLESHPIIIEGEPNTEINDVKTILNYLNSCFSNSEQRSLDQVRNNMKSMRF